MSTYRKSLRSVGLAWLVFGIGVTGAQTPVVDEKDLSVTADTPPTHDATVGSLAGSAGTEGGAATYNVPIVVPPGRAGMQPSLALTYNSRGGDGVMGLGWSISGLSSIHRCPQTLEQDGKALGVNYSASDRLCLDGQRLVNVSGTYGAVGAEYRTEIDSYARITQTGGDLTSSTACFRVEQKDGRILHFGAVTDGTPLACLGSGANARVKPSGAAATLSWLAEKIEDRAGNNEWFVYSNFGNGEVLPGTVTYTGYGPAMGDRTVTFDYQARSAISASLTDQASSSYLAGGLTMQTKALLSVTTKIGTATVRTVKPGYTVSPYSNRLQVQTLTECAYSGAQSSCHPATQFTSTSAGSQPAAQNFHLSPMPGVPAPQGNLPPIDTAQMLERADDSAAMRTMAPTSTNPQDGVTQLAQVAGDFDGDGTREMALGISRTDGQHDYVVRMQADRTAHEVAEVTGILCYYWDCYADFAGDGRSEAIVVPHSAADGNVIRLAVWTLGRGAPIPSGTNPFHLIPTNIQIGIFPPSSDPPGGVPRALDLNGDGKLDLVVERPDASCDTDADLGPKLGVYVYLNTIQLDPNTHQIIESNLFDNGHKLLCLARANTGSNLTVNEHIDHVSDFNGDGLPDLFLVDNAARNTPSLTRVALLQRSDSSVVEGPELSCTAIGLVSSGTALTDECQWSNGYAIRWMDVNGDGLEDFVIARPNEGTWKLRLNTGGHFGAVITTTGTGSHAGLENYQNTGPGSDPNRYFFKYATRVPTMDVDGDGKADLTVVSAQQGFAVRLCTAAILNRTPPNTEGCPVSGGLTATCIAYACPQEPGTGDFNMPGLPGYPGFGKYDNRAVFPMYGSRQASNFSIPDFGYADSSAYHLAAIRFVQTSASAFAARLEETPLVSSLMQAGAIATSQDVFGDGLNDLIGHIGCQYRPFTPPGSSTTYDGCLPVKGAYGPANLTIYATPTDTTTSTVDVSTFATATPFYLNQNVGSTGFNRASDTIAEVFPPSDSSSRDAPEQGFTPLLPDLPYNVIEGDGNYASWALTTLSSGLIQALPDGSVSLPLYCVYEDAPRHCEPQTGGYTDSRHYYFTSSMPVVSGMLQNNGAGDQVGFRSAIYGYTEAMYNHFGRGFQGFRTITSWVAALDVGRQTQTKTTYNQKFPLTGKVESIATVVPATGAVIDKETDTWICTLANRATCPQGDTLPTPTGNTVYAPVLDKQHVEHRDLGSGALVNTTDTVNAVTTTSAASGWDAYGNLKNQLVTRADNGGFVTSHTVKTTNLYPADGTFANCVNDVASWRIADLCQSTVTTAIAYASGHALPGGATAPPRTVATTYQWNANRTPLSQTVQPGIAFQERTTAWTYPTTSYGLPSRISVSGSGVTPSPRSTQFTYTKDGTSVAADGYFVLTTTNPALQATTTEHSTLDGQVKRTIDPNNLQTIAIYDVFGRMTGAQYLNTVGGTLLPSATISYTRCSGGNPSTCAGGYGEDASQDWAAIRVTRVQSGFPTAVDWVDVLGRPIKHAERGFDGTFVAHVTDYDEMGTVEQTSTPYLIGGVPAYFTGWDYDRIGRPTLKQSPGGDIDQTHTVLTSYTYNGRKTTIKVRGSGVSSTCSASTNLCMDMSRSYDGLGRLEQTTQNNGATANYATTNYWYDGAGNAVALQDAEGNVIQASYDDLGRRTQVVDPDAGTKSFGYDALGELLTQTDARGVSTSHRYDALGRLFERTATDNTAVAPLPKVIRDTWAYDPSGTAGGVGLLDYAQRQTGTSTTTLAQIWKEVDRYEPTTKRLDTQTSTLDGQASAWTTSHDYDTNGREQTTTYPSGQVVKKGYTTYGELNQLSDNATGSVYWSATAKDAWGNTTGETYIGGLTGGHTTLASTGQVTLRRWAVGAAGLLRLDYRYDSFGNLAQQITAIAAPDGRYYGTENYMYDALQRLTGAGHSSTFCLPDGSSCTTTDVFPLPGYPNPLSPLYTYTPSGNISFKDDFSTNAAGAYIYRTNGCGPHGVSQVATYSGAVTYQCDASGNVVGGNTLTSGRYDFENRPWSIARVASGSLPAGQVSYEYDANGDRFREAATTQTTWYGPAGFERTFLSPQTTDRIELGPVTLLKVGALTSVRPNLKDRLGSTVAIGNANGTLWQTRNYDAFGKPRNGDLSDRPDGTLGLSQPTLRGFTGHEHVDDVRLIHMNGRMYDPQLGRFLSVDPVIQFPSNSQSLNPYSYILNNPLSGRDPTGYAACTGSHIDRNDGSSCRGQGVSGGGSNGPSKEQQALGANGTSAGMSRSNGAVASGGLKGPGEQRAPNVAATDAGSSAGSTSIPTLETVTIGGSYSRPDESVVPGDWSTSMNGRILNAEWGRYRDDEESRIANETFKALAWEAYGKPALITAGSWYFGALIADIMYLNEGAATLGAATAGDVVETLPAFARSQYGRVSSAERTAALDKSPICPYCGRSPSTQVDHITALRQDWQSGGWADSYAVRTARANSFDNLIGACASCNASKGARQIGANQGQWWPPGWQIGESWPYGGP